MTQHDARLLPLQAPKGSVLDCCRAGVALWRATAVLMVVAALLWALVTGRYEGATWIVLVRGHGLTVGDLPSVVLVLASGWFLLPATESTRGLLTLLVRHGRVRLARITCGATGGMRCSR